MPIKLPIERTRGLTELLNELGCKTGAEIGTANGQYAKWMFSRIKGLKLYCVDPYLAYRRYVEMSDKDGQHIYDKMFADAQARLAKKSVVFIRKTSAEAINDFEDNSLDFVYIDGNHSFEYAVFDIAEWERKVRIGGVVAGHDYWNSIEKIKFRQHKLGVDQHEPNNQIERLKLCQVKDAVIAWTKTNVISPWFITNENWRSSGPSWAYIKQ